jgi:hypothetical protein
MLGSLDFLGGSVDTGYSPQWVDLTIRRAVPEWPLIAHCCRSASERGTAGIRPKPTIGRSRTD